ncbi:MAG: FmdB family zinc ribbon protein [Gemmatimonadaceae bacterium]
MPLHEFRCPQGHDFEKFYRSMSAAKSEEKCPECGGVAGRLMSRSGLVFKGSGFYITDYGKDGKKAERDAATARETKPEAAPAESKTADAPAAPADKAAAAPAKAAPDAKPATPAPKPAPAPKKAE